MASGDRFDDGESVKVKIHGEAERAAVVSDKTRGDATEVKYPDGTTELIANKAIERRS